MEATPALALAATEDLAACWTPTDQRIMEHLLLDQSGAEDHHDAAQQDAGGSPCAVELNKPAERKPVAVAANPNETESERVKRLEEERRARHREVQRRFIQRKKEEAKRTKRLAQELERKFGYLQMANEEKSLKQENRQLQARVDAAATAMPAVPQVDPVELLIQNQLELVQEFFEPLTPAIWTAIQHNTQQEYELSRRDDTYVTSGASIMGWNDFRKVDDTSVKFVLSKAFPNVRALDLLTFTWQCLSNPSTYASFFSPAFTLKMQILQVISRDAIVIHRVLYNPQTQSSSNSLELMWRARLGTEYVIFDSALQNNAVQECLGASYKWTQMTTSLGFAPQDPVTGNGCVFRHGGWLRTAITNVDYWFMEMFFMALRFESTMVSPVFALPSDE